jgi:hypothetical protein
MLAEQPANLTLNLRWYRLTPDRLILGLLILEGFLLLSERFCWFAFNERKGMTLLIAVGVLGVVLLILLLWFIAALVLRRRFQYGIRSLLFLTVIVAILCNWCVEGVKQANRQQEAVLALHYSGGSVKFDNGLYLNGITPSPDKQPCPVMLRTMLGDDYFRKVIFIDLGNEKSVSDSRLKSIEGLSDLETLHLEFTNISDAGSEHLKGLKQLRMLDLSGTKITDEGLIFLKNLLRLKNLYLFQTNITDVGLEYIKGLNQLECLELGMTKVTDQGIKDLQKAMPNLKITRNSR